jgi:hypothetical protein
MHPAVEVRVKKAAAAKRPRRMAEAHVPRWTAFDCGEFDDCKSSSGLSGGVYRLPMFTILPGLAKRKIWGVKGK